MIHYTNADGYVDTITQEEVDAIERSGRSSWQEYIGMPAGYVLRRSIVTEMGGRPGANDGGPVEPQLRPGRRWKPLDQMKKGVIHCRINGKTLCTGKQRRDAFDVDGFRAALGHERVCQHCARVYYQQWTHGRRWTEEDVERLMRLWPDYRQRKRLVNELRRTYAACNTRYRDEQELRWGRR
jgi:hypothetical protein